VWASTCKQLAQPYLRAVPVSVQHTWWRVGTDLPSGGESYDS